MAEPPRIRRARVRGVAFWSPQLPGWDVAARAFRGETDLQEPPSSRPSPAMLAPTERRRAPDTVALALEVAARACASAGIDPASLPSVFACTYGDLAISDYMAATLAENPQMVSPIRFHNSVHNAAAGYWSIGTGCGEAYTALSAAGGATFGAGLLEALVQVECDARPALLVAYDSEARGPLATVLDSRGLLAAALVLAPDDDPHGGVSLGWSLVPGSAATPPRSAAARALQGNAMSGCATLFEALALDAPARVSLSLQPELQLQVEVQPAT